MVKKIKENGLRTDKCADLTKLRHELPTFLSRKHPKFKEFTGYSPRTMANLDSLGQTKSIKKIMLGGAVCYERESLVDWLESHSYLI